MKKLAEQLTASVDEVARDTMGRRLIIEKSVEDLDGRWNLLDGCVLVVYLCHL